MKNQDKGKLATLTAQGVGTVFTPIQSNEHHRGAMVVVDITAATGLSVVFSVQFQDTASGKWITLLSSAALTAVGTTLLTVFPGVAAVANSAVSTLLPRNWRVQAVVGTGTMTATVGAHAVH